jgi:hypothetical protein
MGMFHHGVLGGCPLCMICIILGSTLRDGHRVLSTTLLQFDYSFYEVRQLLFLRYVGWIAQHFYYLESC